MAASKEGQALAEFRKHVAPIPEDHDDNFLLKWLEARNYNVLKAVEMYQKSMKWREMVGADHILERWDPPEVLKRYYPGGCPGFDKEGYPVWLDLVSYADFRGLLRSAKKSDIVLYEAAQIEKGRRLMKAQTEKLGKKIDQIVVIMDLEKLGLKNLSREYIGTFNSIMEMTESNYPENLKTCYIINAPKIFPLAYNTARPFLSEATREKIKVLGGDWKEKLLETISADQLPVRWGGTQKDPDGDPSCKSKICLGGEIPEKYYLTSAKETNREHYQEVIINHGSTLPLSYDVDKPGSRLRWEFVTEQYDIGFTIYLSHSDNDAAKNNSMKELIPSTRVNSHLVPQDGYIVCQTTGKYWLVFDNSYSWLHKKRLAYCVWVEPPGEVDDMNNRFSKVSLEDDQDTAM